MARKTGNEELGPLSLVPAPNTWAERRSSPIRDKPSEQRPSSSFGGRRVRPLERRARTGWLHELSVQGLAETAEGFPRRLALVLDFLGSPFYLLDRLPLFIHDAPSRGDTPDERGKARGVGGNGRIAISHASTLALVCGP